MNVHDRLNSALPSLSLPEERCGPQRGSQLKEPERALYRWILRSFAVSGCPSPDALANAARDVGVDDVEEALARMVDHDLIQRSISGAITRAYPFSAIPTNHVVTLDNGHRLYAMCAVDALGVPIMVGTGATVTTEDPVSGVDIAIHGEPRHWTP